MQRSMNMLQATILIGFLTFYRFYDCCACHYQSFEGWMGSGLHNTTFFALRKGKTSKTLRLHVCHGKLRSTRGCLDTEILSVKFSYYAR